MTDSKKSSHEPQTSKANFWTTLPGILTGIAAVFTALAALIGGLSQAGYLSRRTAPTHATESKQSDVSATQGERPSMGTTTPPTSSETAKGTPSNTSREVAFSANAAAGEADYKVLSARVERFGIDPLTEAKMLLLHLRMRVTNHRKYPGLFTPECFRLEMDGIVRAPKDYPSKTVAAGASEDGEITFVVPEDSKKLVLRVGYGDQVRAEIPLTFPLTPL